MENNIKIIQMLFIGLLTGMCSGIFGIGGGVILVPILVMFLGFSQHTANGTSLVALLLPVGFLGVYEYYKLGKIGNEQIKYGLLIALGIFTGTYFGAKIAGGISDLVLKRSFSILLLFVAVRLWFLAKT